MVRNVSAILGRDIMRPLGLLGRDELGPNGGERALRSLSLASSARFASIGSIPSP